MNRLFNELKNIFAVIIIIVILLSYFGVFIPLKNELEDSIHENFRNLVSIAEMELENHLSRALIAAESLSRRTMIKNELGRYIRGEISFSQLQRYIQAKYEDEASVLKNILAAYRFIDHKVVAHYGGGYLEVIDNLKFSQKQDSLLKINEDQKYIILKSPIKDEQGNKLGSDYLIYDLRGTLLELNHLNSEDINYTILSSSDQAESEIENDDLVERRRLLGTDYYLKAETTSALIYDKISNISYRIMLTVLAAVLIISLIVIKFLHKASVKIVESLRKELEEKTKEAETDEMLGIYNRSKFNQELNREIDRAKRYNNSLSLIMIDIDYFKEFNDNFGHHVGDEILKKIVSIVREKIRKHDILARYGGDEFMLICPETELQEAEMLAERLNRAIDSYNCEHDNNLSCSFGVAEFKAGQNAKESLIKRVDQALYRAKDEGRNCVCRNGE
ncbi:diguanylate cyclase (GGDEF)-like protein [Halanaerobium saccharolyticum]|uniref:Diguanylate cyclase (GGDEF)-like protein n=1 Tax=Halanaerobium saccharolyticum TaxID=43595 RepID=A0A4R6LMR5_9FIRM|nr:GGDEF domain-containing protein [Halanaerobium saccharolyticum]TDO84360.1 diguanylate cyclase (GGDEF)-like protein [Halanaerobium saccharolyticum]